MVESGVVILYFCESMWYFLVEANLYRFVIVYLYGLSMEINLSRGSGWEPINPFNPPRFCACSNSGPGFPIPNQIKKVFIYEKKV
jgi:hypothetical protein